MNEGWSIWYAVRTMLSTQWKVLVVCLAIGAMLGSIYGLRQPTTYVARSEIVTGTYSLPVNIGTASVVAKAGPLALELPAETQSRIISSPAMVGVAAENLGLTAEQKTALADGVNAKPTTDNSFAITAPGKTAQKAADNANAIAKAYLAYRTDVGRGELDRLAQQAKGQAASSTAAAKAMDKAISNALTNPSYASTLLTRQQELDGAAATASVSADQLTAMSKSFTGGGSLLQPATAFMASESIGTTIYLAIGALAGLAFGVLFSAVRRQFSDRILDRQDIIRATGFRAVFSNSGTGGTNEKSSLILRSVLGSARGDDAGCSMIAVRALSTGANPAQFVLQLAEAAINHDLQVAVVMLDGAGNEKLLAPGLHGNDGTAWEELPAREQDDFEKSRGLKAAKILVSPGSRNSIDVVFAVAGVGDGCRGGLGGLPSTFDGPIILLVQENWDKAHVLHETVEQLESALMSVGAVVLISRDRRRSWSGRTVAGARRTRRMRHHAAEPGTQTPSVTGTFEIPPENSGIAFKTTENGGRIRPNMAGHGTPPKGNDVKRSSAAEHLTTGKPSR